MTASVTLVRDALQAVLATIPGTTVYVDRARGDALGEFEMPGLVLNMGDPAFGLFDGSATMQHVTQADIEIYEKATDGGPSIGDQQQARLVQIVAALGADPTLGGRLQDLNVLSASGTESNAADIGAMTVTIELSWFTPPWDFGTIQGQSGLFT